MNSHEKNNNLLQPRKIPSATGKISAVSPLSVGKQHTGDHQHCCTAAEPVLDALPQGKNTGRGTITAIRIMQMDCPVEENLITGKLSAMPGVVSLQFDLMQRILTVTHRQEILDDILQAIRSLGFEPELPGKNTASSIVPPPPVRYWPLITAIVLAFAAESLSWLQFPGWLQALCALAAVLLAGIKTYKKGWIAIKNLNLNINALMSVAVTGALLLQQWPEAAMVMVLFNIAEMIEAKALDRARNAIDTLLKLAPEWMNVRQADNSWKPMQPADVPLSAIVRVKPGEKIGLDGIIVRGNSTVNQSAITGESLPVEKKTDDQVFAGTLNESGSFEYQVTSVAQNTTLAKIIRSVESARASKAPTQRFVDQFARIYTPVIFLLAFAVAILPPLFFGLPWTPWIYNALVMLVIACPCALVISTPVTLVSSLTAAARMGILIKGGVYLEQGKKLQWLALDKTGTLTQGKPEVTDVITPGMLTPEQAQAIAGSLSAYSDHPVSEAVTRHSEGVTPLTVNDFTSVTGQGITGIINNEEYWLGNRRLLQARGVELLDTEERYIALEKQGKTLVFLGHRTGLLAVFALADTVKLTSKQAIDELHQLGVKTLLLSGDNPFAVSEIARQVGIDQAKAQQLPDDKLRAIEEYSRRGVTGMAGDGINDTPALARADIGFAMGIAGTDTAIETADVALMDDDLRKIPMFVRLSRKNSQILTQNISLSLAIKLVFLVMTLFGAGTLWMAVFADVGASLLVVANGLRILRYSANA
ncbi:MULTISPECIES: heavy metal translocating P-type ATPase [unclassified Tatumella]|uniref:heavy metal translocating P-type ATPase n=1 Tax=unclassified Tatumella TaxID=2649542 RepID=UPI002013801F|nr:MULTISPECIES: heavy metal translocating P-type ATPase [unclassified Tatumella]